MTDFEISYSITRKIEGGWHSGTGINSNDRGGETFKGIARKIWPKWEGWRLVDQFKQRPGFPQNAENDPALKSMVQRFFKVNFWDPLRLDQIRNQEIKNELFDTAVNSGVSVAARFLQRGLNYLNRDQRTFPDIATDGKIGPQTLATLNLLGPEDQKHLFNLLNILQGGLYLMIMDRDRGQEVNIRGWLKRVELMK